MTPARRPKKTDASAAYEPRRINDPQALNALAHPVRLGILELLSVSGPMTATELAEELDETPANCSWHLRKLADYDFVVPAEAGTGRRRPWQLTGLGFQTGGPDASREEQRASRGLQRVLLQRFVDRYLAAVEQLAEEPGRGWAQAAGHTEMGTWLTLDELTQVQVELRAILERHVDRLMDESKRPPGSRLVELVAWGAPVDMQLKSKGDR